MRDHRKREVFRLAGDLTLHLYQATRRFPEDERYGLAGQIRRAAVSIAANIVEGSARPSRARFLLIAYSSACELQYEVSLACRLGYLANEFDEASLRVCKALRSFMLAIQRT